MSAEPFAPGWLHLQMQDASRVVASWSEEKRERMLAYAAPPPTDPCRCKRACDEAQTCVGGCVYGAGRDPVVEQSP